jgi:uncharacterized membrane protein YhfC
MNILYLTYPLSAILIFIAVIATAVFLTEKFNLGWRLFWIGGFTFILSQVGHIPFNQYILGPVLARLPSGWESIGTALLLGLSAGLWEELFRYATYRWWARDARNWPKALVMGSGHGGMEALLIGGLVLYAYLRMVALQGADLSSLVSPDLLELARQSVASYWSIPWPLSLMSAVERIFTLPTQIAFSVLVLQTFTRKQSRWLWFAVAWHALIDAAVVYVVPFWGIYITEGLIGLIALINIWLILRLRPVAVEDALEVTPQETQIIPQFEMPELDESPQKLDETRYN